MNPENHVPTPFEAPEAIAGDLKHQLEMPVTLGILALAAGSLLLLPGLFFPARCSGATRSARVRWEQRQAEMQQSTQEINSANTAPHAGNSDSQ